MSRTMWLVSMLGLGMLCGICASCEKSKDVEQVELDSLPYLQETHHPELRAELARLEAERTTPRLLDASQPGQGTTEDRAQRLLEELNQICPMQDLRLTVQRVERIYPADEFRFGPVNLENAREINRLYGAQLDLYRKVFHRDDFQFSVSLSNGLLANLDVLDHAMFAHRLEALSAADLLAAGEPGAALLTVRNMLLIDKQLAAVPNVSARRAAARLRGEAFAVAAALVQHPRWSQALCGELRQTLEAQLLDWTADRVAWVGDRALGLHAYELVRDGQLMNILTAEEIAKLQGERNLDTFDQAVRLSLDDDEWFYLSTMRRVIASCSKSYYKRSAVFDETKRELDRLLDTPRYPLFAANVLLPNLEAVHREQAIDRARCEAWVIALRAVAGLTVDSQVPNPVTGETYNVTRDADTVIVSDLTAKQTGPAVVVPVPPER